MLRREERVKDPWFYEKKKRFEAPTRTDNVLTSHIYMRITFNVMFKPKYKFTEAEVYFFFFVSF